MQDRKKLDYIDYFRAIAIILIVAGHTLCWGHSTMKEFNKLLFAGGTYFFVFIAGYLFQYLANDFDIVKYYKKKITNVICPFVISLFPVALLYTIQNVDQWSLQPLSNSLRFCSVFFGGHLINPPVWFVGMISIIFLFSPLFLYLKKHKKKIYLTIFLMSIVCTLVFSRMYVVSKNVVIDYRYWSLWDIIHINFVFYFKCFLHFCFFYLLGMELCSFVQNHSLFIKKTLKSIFKISLFLYVFHFIAHLFIVKCSNDMELVSKFIEIFVLLSGLMLFEDKIKNNSVLDKSLKVIAKYSFGIFFIHYYIINYFYYHTLYSQRNFIPFVKLNKNTMPCFLTAIEMFFVTLLGSILFLFVLKMILKLLGVKNTRMIIGV